MEENEQRLTTEAERIKGDATREIDHDSQSIQIFRQTTDLALMVGRKSGSESSGCDTGNFADDARRPVKSYRDNSRTGWVSLG